MKIVVESYKKILEITANQIINIVKEQENPYLLLTSENSLIDLYQKIIQCYRNEIISFIQSKIFILSEYINSDKNKIFALNKIIDDNLIKKIDLKSENFYYPKDVFSYNQILNNISFFDFTLLYLDSDLKISFNHLEGKLINRTKIVGLSDYSIKNRFKNEDNHPQLAITMGIKDIFYKSKKIFLLILGDDKKKIINDIRNNNGKQSQFLKFLLMHHDLTILTNVNN
ncbi:MAG: hypothetical protein HPPSJP_2870 [Candidatus Hepatoplasma scabrum]|nr:MAG: hypothetical protein HPPSJP_2870 [Candidatus Hepatoplasma sp.]